LAIYFSIGTCQPFAKMETSPVDGFESVAMVTADGDVVGIRLDDPREVLRLDELIEALNLNPERIWSRLRADDDVLNSRRQATWGGGGA
jgi:hypothetical protein